MLVVLKYSISAYVFQRIECKKVSQSDKVCETLVAIRKPEYELLKVDFA